MFQFIYINGYLWSNRMYSLAYAVMNESSQKLVAALINQAVGTYSLVKSAYDPITKMGGLIRSFD